MATAKIIKQEIRINLELSEFEAMFLKGLTQNSLQEKESEKENKARGSIFSTLTNALLNKNDYEDI